VLFDQNKQQTTTSKVMEEEEDPWDQDWEQRLEEQRLDMQMMRVDAAYNDGSQVARVQRILASRNFNVNDADQNGWMSLHWTLSPGSGRGSISPTRVKLIKWVLDLGADVGLATTDGSTALHFAVTRKRDLTDDRCIEALGLLLRHDSADANAVDMDGCTPLHKLARAGVRSSGFDIEVVKLLLANGADPTILDKHGYTALDEVISNVGSTLSTYEDQARLADMAGLLLAHGVNANGKVHNGMSLLQFCAYKNKSDLVMILLDNGANVIGNCGRLALDIACERGHISCIYVLFQNMYGSGLIHF
jgi:ankyrin repeat protein